MATVNGVMASATPTTTTTASSEASTTTGRRGRRSKGPKVAAAAAAAAGLPPTAAADSSHVEASVEKRGGARRKRNEKRKKQRTPDTTDVPTTDADDTLENTVNNASQELVISSDTVNKKREESYEEEEEEESKFVWQSVTKSGSVKKCILVDGISSLGRPQVGDTVLVKSQGKLRNGSIIDDHPTLVFSVGEHEVIEGLEVAVQSMFKNELSVVSLKPEVAYGSLGRKSDVPSDSRLTYLLGLLHFEKQRDIRQLTWAQRRKAGQSRMRLANWWYQRKQFSIAVKCYKRALEFYNHNNSNTNNMSGEESRELLQLMEERLRVMRQVASIFKRIANQMQSGQVT